MRAPRTRAESAIAAVRAAGLALCLAVAAGCASFSAAPAPSDIAAKAPRVSGVRGPLSREESAAILAKVKQKSGADDILLRHVAVEEAVARSPLVAGNAVSLLEDGPATYKAMFAAIERARDHINLQTYIFEDDEVGQRFAEALMAKQAKGVQVNLIYDSVGSIRTPKEFFERMRGAGVRVLEFGPVNPLASRKGYSLNQRDHRKLLIADGRVAFIGGINISSVYSSSPSLSRPAPSADARDIPWRDTHVRIEGPVVREFQKLFLGTWEKQRGEPLPQKRYFPQPSSSAGAGKPEGHLVRALASDADDAYSPIYVTLLSAIDSAESSIDVTMAYFLPDDRLLGAITGAASRGVKVRIVLPSKSDFWAVFHAGRARYSALLRAGVQVYERGDALLHAKTAVIDGVWSTVGSTNFDPRSFLHNDEVNAVILGHEFAREMTAMFEKDLRESTAITAEAWRGRSITDRVKELASRVWEYWM
jgi:cardiolipin synthase